MFDSLQDNLKSAFKSLRGKGKLTEANMRDGLALVEESLVEADVAYPVVKDFMSRVTERALGQRVLLSLDPSEQVVGIVQNELVELLGPVDASLHLKKDLTKIMLCGLQGSGKTTTCGKLAKLLLDSKVRTMLVAADLQRPAAIDQLHVLGEQLGLPVYSERDHKDPVKVCQNALKKAKEEDVRVVIFDTAGRLAIDEELMKELQRVERATDPDQLYFVVDGMTGQDAVNSAGAFNDALELDGVIMTKLDGDTRGGALLSVKKITGVPIKFIGEGEHLTDLSPFSPEGMASRILGRGDIVGLVQEAQRIHDEKEQEELQKKLMEGQLTLDDFKVQMQKIMRPGLMQKMMGMIPGMPDMKELLGGDEDATGGIKKMVGMIDSMTPAERRNPNIIDNSRRARIAKGSGAQAHEVNGLVKQFNQMKPMMEMMAGKSSMAERMQMMQQIQQQAISNPAGGLQRVKKGTGTRLSSADKKKQRKQREKERRKKKKGK